MRCCTLVQGVLTRRQRRQVCEIYHEAFAQKRDRLILFPRSKKQALRIYEENINFEAGRYVLSKNDVVGVMGLDYEGHRFLKLKWSTLSKEFFLFGAIYRKVASWVDEVRKPRSGELTIKALAVRKDMRGKGIGSQLLHEAINFAKHMRFHTISLQVVDTNTSARFLYERMGFSAVAKTRYGFLTKKAGFSSIIRMKQCVAVKT
ncbi:MAG: GNAT family N-acetyltransferase [Candidatus Woesearchaeota archaeon]|nr:MAG: GNAT family N-acetyltransferase [Candidatus Woesearchaeota archaeon]